MPKTKTNKYFFIAKIPFSGWNGIFFMAQTSLGQKTIDKIAEIVFINIINKYICQIIITE